jgi:ABC-type amino acid transport substrate-binding protein
VRLAAAVCLAIAAMLAVVTRTSAESSLDAIRGRGELRVGVRTDVPLLGFRGAGGGITGFEIDLARYLARVLFDDERQVQLVPVTAANRFEELQAGRVDLLLATVTATDERRELAELSDPYFMSGTLILVPASSDLRRTGDLDGRRVAVLRRSVHERDVPERHARVVLRTVESVLDGVRAIRSGDADAFVHDDVPLLMLAHNDAQLRVIGPPLVPRPYVAAARKGDTGLIRWVNGWLARMRRDGSYVHMWRRYFQPFESRLVGG